MTNVFSDLESDVGPESSNMRAKAVNGSNGHSGEGWFGLVNAIPILDALEWLHIEYKQHGERIYATCPECGNGGERSDVVVLDNALKCPHNSCAGAGPRSAPGLRTVVDLTMLVHDVDKLTAVKMLAERFGIELPRRKPDNIKDEHTQQQATSRVLTADDIFATPNHIDTLVPGLGIKPGPVVMAVARSGVGKSVILQSAAISSALGQPWWGLFPVQRPLRIHWIDLEQGKQTTLLRFKRNALARSLTPDDLRGKIDVSISPKVENEAQLVKLFEGYDLAFIDCYRVLAGGIDENDSRAREPLDACARASETTQCAVVVIHHGRKEVENNRGGTRDATRGSSAIQDACDAVYHFGRDGDEPEGPIACQCTKVPRATGKAPQPWTLEIQDVDLYESADLVIRDGGLTVIGSRQAKADPFDVERANRGRKIEKVQAALRVEMSRQPVWTNLQKLASQVRLRKQDVTEAIATMPNVTVTGKPPRATYTYQPDENHDA